MKEILRNITIIVLVLIGEVVSFSSITVGCESEDLLTISGIIFNFGEAQVCSFDVKQGTSKRTNNKESKEVVIEIDSKDCLDSSYVDQDDGILALVVPVNPPDSCRLEAKSPANHLHPLGFFDPQPASQNNVSSKRSPFPFYFPFFIFALFAFLHFFFPLSCWWFYCQ